MSKPLAWSFSSLNAYEQCPHRYKLTRVTKEVKEPPNDANIWGNAVHEALEFYVKEGRPLPETMAKYQAMIDKLATAPGIKLVELEIALNRDFQPVSWFAKDAWVRGIIDIGIERDNDVFIGDYKTGKRKPDSDQLDLFAALLFHARPHLTTATSAFLWLKDGKLDKAKYTRDDLPRIWNNFLPRVARIELAMELDKWPKRPSGLCRSYCPVGKQLCGYCGG